MNEMPHQTTTDELAGKLREIADELDRAAADLDKLRRERYRKWNQPEVIVDVLELSPTPLAPDQIIAEMKRCGYRFQPTNTDPRRSLKASLSKLKQEGRVVRVARRGRFGEFTWRSAGRGDG